MGSLVGHAAPGLVFILIGLWHLWNHTKLHALNPTSYTAPPTWFPISKSKYLELLLIMAGTTTFISLELFVISAPHLHNLEHSSIALTFFLYASLTILLDRLHPPAKHALTQLLAAVAFAQQLLVFHLHSADHVGPVGQYHMLLQLLILVSLATTLLGIPMRDSFLLFFVRSLSIFFQGLWLVAMGFMLWTPGFVAKGCFINDGDGVQVVRCDDEDSLRRALALVNILFSCFIVGVTVFGVAFYLGLVKFYLYREKVEYVHLVNEEEGEKAPRDDVESQTRSIPGNTKSETFIHVAKTFSPVDIGG